MSLDINRVIMEATSSLLETQNTVDDKGDKPQVSADKNSLHVPADKPSSTSTTAPVKPVTETEAETEAVKPVTETETAPVKTETVSVKPVTESAVTDVIKKIKDKITTAKAEGSKEGYQAGPQSAEPALSKVEGDAYTPSGADVETDYMSAMKKLKNYGLPTAAIAAGLGAVALAKKLRKAKKAAKKA